MSTINSMAQRRLGMQRRRGKLMVVGPLTVLQCPTEDCPALVYLHEIHFWPLSPDLTICCGRCGVVAELREWLAPRWPEALENALEEVCRP